MGKNDLHFDLPSKSVDGVVSDVARFFKNERDIDLPESVIRQGIVDVLGNKFDRYVEDMGEMFMSPHRPEMQELESLLERRLQRSPIEAAPTITVAAESNIFNGNKIFSPKKLEAMIGYISSRSYNIYKTNLNKLLFYADLTSYYLRQVGMSGSVYYNRPFGPVADETEQIVNDMIADDKLKLVERTKTFESSPSAMRPELENDEIKVLDWVLETYGNLGAGEISDLSHLERAYANTQPNEQIAYRYAQFLKHLPPQSLLKE